MYRLDTLVEEVPQEKTFFVYLYDLTKLHFEKSSSKEAESLTNKTAAYFNKEKQYEAYLVR